MSARPLLAGLGLVLMTLPHAPAQERAEEHLVLAAIARVPEFAPLLLAAGAPRGDAHGVVTPTDRVDGAVALSSGRSSIVVRARVGSSRRGVGTSVRVFPDALPEMDIVHVIGRGAMEELRVLRGPAAPRTASYDIELGGDARDARLIDGRVEILSSLGQVVFTSEPVVAFDALGTRRPASVALHRTERGFVLTTELEGEGLVHPIVVDPGWRVLSQMRERRRQHTATLLPPGRVLVTGGSNGTSTPLSSAEVWDQKTGEWTATASMKVPRYGHSALMLSSGKVLVVAGAMGATLASEAEIYDPGTGTWSLTGPPSQPRGVHTANLLPSGQVLIAGGEALGKVMSSVELYDPSSGSWSNGPALPKARDGHTATVVGSGAEAKLIVAGGWTGVERLDDAWAFDAGKGAWTSLGRMRAPHRQAVGFALSDGRLLLAGGFNAPNLALSTAEIYDPKKDTWTLLPDMKVARRYHAVFEVAGQPVVMGGRNATGFLSSAEIFDAAKNDWVPISASSSGRDLSTATNLDASHVLIAGGTDESGSSCLSTAEILEWAPLGSACTSQTECAIGTCVDGVCCDRPCNGACEACAEPGKIGTCVPVAGTSRPGHPSCGAARCDGSSFIAGGTCDGAGACTTGNAVACAPYACLDGCLSACAVDSDCAAGFVCGAGVCDAPPPEQRPLYHGWFGCGTRPQGDAPWWTALLPLLLLTGRRGIKRNSRC